MHQRNAATWMMALLFLAAGLPATASADELTQKVQIDLVELGYEPGNVDGELDDLTVAAIAQFQAERNMPVTGEVTPLLSGVIAAEVSKQAPPAVAAEPAQDPAALKAAQQACLQEKMAAAQAAQKKKSGFGSLMSAVSRTAKQTGNYDVIETTQDVYSANATAADLSAAARDLGLTEDEVAECQNPK